MEHTMITITIREIQRDLLGYLQRVKGGETVVIMDADEPLAEIKPVEVDSPQLRPYALCAEKFNVPADFNAPLPDELIALFEG